MHWLLFASESGGHAANGFFIGDLKETLISAAASIIVFALLAWKAGPAIKGALTGRSDRIAKEIDDAEKSRTEAEAKLAEVQSRIANAENERQRILVEARQTAESVKTGIVARAEDEAAALKARAGSDIEASKQQAIADLQAEVASLALGAAEAVIAANLDAATQQSLVDGSITQVGAVR